MMVTLPGGGTPMQRLIKKPVAGVGSLKIKTAGKGRLLGNADNSILTLSKQLMKDLGIDFSGGGLGPKALGNFSGGGLGPKALGNFSGGGGGGSSSSSSSSSSGSGIEKSDDRPLIEALNEMLNSSFAAQRDTVIGNINRRQRESEADLLAGYRLRARSLTDSRLDNERAEADLSFANLANRARERADIIDQAALQGAGESDTARSMMMALRNWDANQNDINRSFYDTQTSITSAQRDLNVDTRTALRNNFTSAQGDIEQAWATFYNQRTDAYRQIGDVRGNPYSNMYEEGSNAYNLAAKESAKAYKVQATPARLQNWEGIKPVDSDLNNSLLGNAVTNQEPKKPEGAKLRKW